MPPRNRAEEYGLVSRLLHGIMAALILVMLGLGTWLHRMVISPTNFWLFGLHKSLGLTLLVLVLLRLAWHRHRPPPVPRGLPGSWQLRLAILVHRLFYILLLAIPLSGWLASSATGIDTVLFNRWTIPPIAPPSETLSDAGFAIHGVLTKMFLALLILHIGGAIRHGLGRDGALRRIWFG